MPLFEVNEIFDAIVTGEVTTNCQPSNPYLRRQDDPPTPSRWLSGRWAGRKGFYYKS